MKTFLAFVWLSAIPSALAEPRRVWVQYADNQRANCLQSLQNSIAKSLSKSLTMATPSSSSSSASTFNQTSGTNLPLEMNFDFPEHSAIVVTAHDEQALLDLQADPSVVNVMDDPKRYSRYIADSLKRVKLDETTNRESRLRGPRELLSYSDKVPYGVSMVEAPSVWQSGYLGSGVTVCMIDTGLDTTNPDISPSSRYTGWDFGNGGKSSSSGWSTDPVGHGTHTTGTVSAAMNNAGIVGVAPSADVMMVRVFNNQGSFVFSSALVDAVRRCRKNSKVKVISMSLGGPVPNPIEAQVFLNAFNANIVNVAAAGNDGTSVLDYPASYNGVISVAAIDQNKQVANFSQRNSKVDICAPGVNVLSTLPMSPFCQICQLYGVTEYGELSGTSMSTPHVSGVAALLFSYNMSASAATITNAITGTAEDLGAKGKDDLYGYGLVQAGKALAGMSGGTITAPPTQSPVYTSPAPTPSFGFGSGASSCSSGEKNVTLLILADNLPEQIEYEFIRESDQQVVWKNGGVVGYGQVFEDSKCLATPSQCYNFSIAVAGGDGLCCLFGQGGYAVFVDGQPVGSNGNFGYFDSFTFGSCGSSTSTAAKQQSGAISTDLPTATAAPTVSGCVSVELLYHTDAYVTGDSVRLYNNANGQDEWHYSVFEPSKAYDFKSCVDPNACYVMELDGTGSYTLLYDGSLAATGARIESMVSYMVGGSNCA